MSGRGRGPPGRGPPGGRGGFGRGGGRGPPGRGGGRGGRGEPEGPPAEIVGKLYYVHFDPEVVAKLFSPWSHRGRCLLTQCRKRNGLSLNQCHDSLLQRRYLP